MAEYICPHCRKPIYDDDALLCFYCGESLERSIGVFGALKYSRPRVITIIIALAILISFVILIMR